MLFIVNTRVLFTHLIFKRTLLYKKIICIISAIIKFVILKLMEILNYMHLVIFFKKQNSQLYH